MCDASVLFANRTSGGCRSSLSGSWEWKIAAKASMHSTTPIPFFALYTSSTPGRRNLGTPSSSQAPKNMWMFSFARKDRVGFSLIFGIRVSLNFSMTRHRMSPSFTISANGTSFFRVIPNNCWNHRFAAFSRSMHAALNCCDTLSAILDSLSRVSRFVRLPLPRSPSSSKATYSPAGVNIYISSGVNSITRWPEEK